ncbi:MAG: GNAT family N-acetyltransferase [Oceanihabitans sp.]
MLASFQTYYIQAIQENNAWDLCNFMVANEDRFKRYLPKTLAQNLTPSLAKHFCALKAKQYLNKEEFLFTIKEKETNKLVGLVYLKEIDWLKKQAEFAYCIGYTFKGKNIITEAVKILSNFAFNTLNLKTLQIIVYKNNLPSVKVAENNNFKWIATLKNEYKPPNEKPLDMELYELHK